MSTGMDGTIERCIMRVLSSTARISALLLYRRLILGNVLQIAKDQSISIRQVILLLASPAALVPGLVIILRRAACKSNKPSALPRPFRHP